MVDRRMNPNGRKYQVKQIWDTHHEILRLLLLGWKSVDIAQHLGMDPVTISIVKNSSVVKQQLRIMQDARDMETIDVAKQIRDLAPRAVEYLEEVLENPDEATRNRLSAAMDLLDRGGYESPKKFEVAHAFLTKEDIDEIKRRAEESKMIAHSVQNPNRDGVIEGECND